MSRTKYRAFSRNRLLASLVEDDVERLRPHLRPVELEMQMRLQIPHEPVAEVYFPETGIASIVAIGADDRRIEAGLFGRDGMTGTPILLGNQSSPNEIFVQLAGTGLVMPGEALHEALGASPTLRTRLLRFVSVLLVQTSHTALANGRARIEERLARWLLMYHDRIDGDELVITHDFLSLMLGVRRPGVTDAVHLLEGQGPIRAFRGRIVIRDRPALETIAGGFYGVPEREYSRLINGAERES